jgi:D-psicose/D-tagatose/L-ribulose 3-epimerase
MKFGVNTFIWSSAVDAPVLEVLPEIRERGFDGVELPLIDLTYIQPGTIRRRLAEADLGCTFCAVLPRPLSLIDPSPEVRERAIQHLNDAIAFAAEAGGETIAGPLYSPVGFFTGTRRTPDEWSRAVEGWQRLGEVAGKQKITIGIEPLNRFETYFLNTAADAVRFCAEVARPEVGILFDTFHANIEEKDVAQAILTAAPHLVHFHACENDRGAPGSGHVDWPNVFATLRQIGYDRWVTIESFGFALGELSAAASIWRDLAPTPADIAFEGVRFLRRGLDVQVRMEGSAGSSA